MKMQMSKYTKFPSRSFGVAVVAAAALFGFLQFNYPHRFVDPDGFYHAKASQLLAQGELTDAFPWLQFSTWKDAYANQHYLYHGLLTPVNNIFTMQWSVVVFGLVFVLIWYLLLRCFVVSVPIAWLGLMLSGSVDFLIRMNFIKANALSLSLLGIVVLLLYKYGQSKDMRLLLYLFVVCLLFVWTYGGFVFVPFLVAVYCLAISVARRKFILMPLVVSLLGIAAGLWLHPHHGNIFSLLYDQLFQAGLGSRSEVPVGSEWRKVNLEWFLKTNALVLLVWFMSVGIMVSESLAERRLPAWKQLWGFFASVGLLVLTIWHRRFIEYFVPFATFFAALVLSPYLMRITYSQLHASWRKLWLFRLIATLSMVAIIMMVGYNLQYVIASRSQGSSYFRFQGVSQWLADNTQPGEIIFNVQWDHFPELFYWNSHNYYVIGLDPTFNYLYDQEKYGLWRTISDDDPDKWGSGEYVHTILIDQFRAKYIFVDSERNPNLSLLLSNQPQLFHLVYYSGKTELYEIR